MRVRWKLASFAVSSLCLGLCGSPAGAVSGVLAKITTVSPPGMGFFDLTWYGTPFAKPTVYLSDQAGIEVLNPRSDTYLGTFGQGNFVPLGKGPAACGPTGGSGPNGILSLTVNGSNQVWAGNGNSTVNVFTLKSPGDGTLAASVSTGGTCRADEFSYDPAQHLVLIANPAEQSNFVSFISVNANPTKDTVVGRISYPNAAGGLEQSVYDPSSGEFYLNVVQTTATNADLGAVDVISPKTKSVVRSFPVIGCAANGMALDEATHELFLGCGRSNALMIMDDRSGAILHTIPGLGGSDEVAFNPTSGDFVAPTLHGGNWVLLAVSAKTGQVLAETPVGGFTHSVATGGDKVFVPVLNMGIQVYANR